MLNSEASQDAFCTRYALNSSLLTLGGGQREVRARPDDPQGTIQLDETHVGDDNRAQKVSVQPTLVFEVRLHSTTIDVQCQ